MIGNKAYFSKVKNTAESTLIDWSAFENKKILISGATGLICSYLIDVLMYRNKVYSNNIFVCAISRSEEKIKARFSDYSPKKVQKTNKPGLYYLIQDIEQDIKCNFGFDYIIHGASNTHPLQYAQKPIETILTNVIGWRNLLDFSLNSKNCRLFLMSSVEVYGENRGDVDYFEEDYLGFINCNSLRAGYPESKRVCEALSQAYIAQKDCNVITGRLSRIFGPTMQNDDSKAIAQFIKKGIKNEDIVLKSDGTQTYSFLSVFDAVSAILFLLTKGENGGVYNIADDRSGISLKDLAGTIAELCNTKVVFDKPSDDEAKGYSTATKALLSSKKINSLGWKAEFDIKESLASTIEILHELDNK